MVELADVAYSYALEMLASELISTVPVTSFSFHTLMPFRRKYLNAWRGQCI